MKLLPVAGICLLALAVLVSGCTSQPAQIPASPAATATPASTPALPETAAPLPLTGTTWNLVWYDDTKGVWTRVVEGSSVTATFFNEGKVTGSGGCNGYAVDFQLGDPQRIWFRRPEVPDRSCQSPSGVMSQESAFFTDLQWAESYSISDGQLVIFNKENKKILQFDSSQA